MSKSIDHDQLFKQLLTTFFLEFLELFTPEFFAAIDPSSLEILPLEYFTDGENLSDIGVRR
jgi:predicted transposase YdaD